MGFATSAQWLVIIPLVLFMSGSSVHTTTRSALSISEITLTVPLRSSFESLSPLPHLILHPMVSRMEAGHPTIANVAHPIWPKYPVAGMGDEIQSEFEELQVYAGQDGFSLLNPSINLFPNYFPLFDVLAMATTDSIGNGEPYTGYDAGCVDIDPPPNCTSNDFIFQEAYLAGDTLGTRLSNCSQGQPTNAYFSLTFDKTNGSTRQGFYVSATISDGDSSIYVINHCFDLVLISSGLITLVIPDEVVTFTCGTNLSVVDAYFAWGSANAASNICNRTSGCADPKCDYILGATPLSTPLVADFSYTMQCPGVDTLFDLLLTDEAAGGSGAFTYDWDFGDGNTSTLANPTHAYADTGVYTIRLIVNDSVGISDTMTVDVLIDVCSLSSCAILGNTTYCAGDSIQLSEMSTATSWSWTGPGGFTDTLQSIVRYPADTSMSGTYKVVVSDMTGPLDSCTVNIVVLPPIINEINYTGCENDGYSIVVNGTTYDEANPDGMDTLTAANGCDSILVIDLNFNPEVVVEAGMLPGPACSGGPLTLADLGASISGGASEGTWTTMGTGMFDNGGQFGGLNPATTYTFGVEDIAAGKVILTLTSVDPAGPCEPDADPVTILINDVTCSDFPYAGY